MPVTEEGRTNLSFICTFDDETEISTWTIEYNGSLIHDVPDCFHRCSNHPDTTLGDNFSTIAWNGKFWDDSIPVFGCSEGRAFNIKNPHPAIKIAKKCLPLTTTAAAMEWQWIDFETQAASIDLPECVELCSNEPPFDETVHERTWREGYFGLGEIAKYQCVGKQSKHCETLLNKTTILK